MKKTSVIGLLAVCVLTAGAVGARAADVITRKSQTNRVAGSVTGVTKTEVTIKPATGNATTIPANDIADIEWDAATAPFKLARSDENGGRLDRALEGYRKVLQEVDPASEHFKTEVEYTTARTVARMALADPGRQDEAVKLLEAFLKQHPDSYQHYPALNWLGRVYLAKADFANAQQTFDKLAQAPWTDFKMAAQTATAQIQMAQDNLDGAIQSFDAVISAPAEGANEQARRYEAMLGKAKALNRQQKFDESAALLKEVVAKAPANDSALMAQAYVLQGDSLQAGGKTKDALLAYLHVDVLFAQETDAHAQSLYHLAQLWKVVQHPERAAEAQAKLEGSYPNSEWTRRLAAGGAVQQ